MRKLIALILAGPRLEAGEILLQDQLHGVRTDRWCGTQRHQIGAAPALGERRRNSELDDISAISN